MPNSVAGAYAEKVPLVVLSGAPGKDEANSGMLLHHQVKRIDSQFQVFKEVTCDQTRLDAAARAPDKIARVLANCLRRSEPVYIEIPRDMVGVECASVIPQTPFAPDPEALDACVEDILERLALARSAVLMVGVEVRRYRDRDERSIPVGGWSASTISFACCLTPKLIVDADHTQLRGTTNLALRASAVRQYDPQQNRCRWRIAHRDARKSRRRSPLLDCGRRAHRPRALRLDPLTGAAQNSSPSIRSIGVKPFAPSVLGYRYPGSLPAAPSRQPHRTHRRALLLCQHAAASFMK